MCQNVQGVLLSTNSALDRGLRQRKEKAFVKTFELLAHLGTHFGYVNSLRHSSKLVYPFVNAGLIGNCPCDVLRLKTKQG